VTNEDRMTNLDLGIETVAHHPARNVVATGVAEEAE